MNREIVISEQHTPEQMVSQMSKLAEDGKPIRFVQEIAAAAREIPDDRQRLKFIHEAVYKMALFDASPDDRQQLKTVGNIQRTRRANCTGYSTVISSILRLLNMPHSFRLVDTDGRGFNHIYVTTPQAVLDCTLGQRQDGTDTFHNRAPYGMFDAEPDFQYKKDFPMLTVVNGSRRAKRIRVNGFFDTLLSPLLGDECRFQCNIKHASDQVARDQCKLACDMGMTEQQYNQWQQSGGSTMPLPNISWPQQQAQARDNTLLYVAAGVAAVYLLTRKK